MRISTALVACQKLQKKYNYNQCNPIGKGGYGVAFDIGDNKVLKLSTHMQEYEQISNNIVGKTIDGLVHYYHADDLYDMKKELGDYSYYVFIMDKVIPLSKSDMNLVSAFKSSIHYFMAKDAHKKIHLWERLYDDIKGKPIIHSEIWHFLTSNKESSVRLRNLSSEEMKRGLKLIYLYIATSKKLMDQGILHRDPHEGNMGWDPYGNFVFFDYS